MSFSVFLSMKAVYDRIRICYSQLALLSRIVILLRVVIVLCTYEHVEGRTDGPTDRTLGENTHQHKIFRRPHESKYIRTYVHTCCLLCLESERQLSQLKGVQQQVLYCSKCKQHVKPPCMHACMLARVERKRSKLVGLLSHCCCEAGKRSRRRSSIPT